MGCQKDEESEFIQEGFMLMKNLFRHWTYQVFAPGTVPRDKHEAFSAGHDRSAGKGWNLSLTAAMGV